MSHFSSLLPSPVEASGEDEWMSEVGERETGAECRLVGRLDFCSFGQLQSILYIDAQVANGAINLCVTKENLNGAEIAGRLVNN